MLAELETTAKAYAVGSSFLDRLVGDFTEAEWGYRDPAGHDPRWLVGHITTYRVRVAQLMGADLPSAPWEGCFGRGKSSADVPADLDIQAVLAAFKASSAAIAGGWDALSPEKLAEPFGRKLPNGTDDVRGAIQFFNWHEAYHLGQLGLLRRLAGRPGAA